jgi:hypothetical protein
VTEDEMAPPAVRRQGTVGLPEFSTHLPDRSAEPLLIDLVSLSDWYRFVPETLGFLVLIFGAQTLLPGISAGGMPHPFWIPVLLMSGQYGIMGGLFATLAATAALFFKGLPAQSATQDFYTYAGIVAAQPCAWFGIALVLGGLRTLHIRHHSELQDRLRQTEVLATDFADGLEQAITEIDRLEQRIAADSTTVASLLTSLADLNLSDRPSIVASVAELLRCAIGATNFAIYLHVPGEADPKPYFGMEDGARVAPAAIALLPPSLHDLSRDNGAIFDLSADQSVVDGIACWAPIWLPGSADLTGLIVCSRLDPARDLAIAVRRLKQIGCVLGALLASCPENSSEKCEIVGPELARDAQTRSNAIDHA